MTSDSTEFRIAIVGTGPAGLYCATELLKTSCDVRIDLIERLSQPFGLLRYGVAPDHSHTRRVCGVFSKPLADPRLRFLGGIDVGEAVTIADLKRCYHAAIIATGSQQDRRLALPGGPLAGCHSAMAFTGWINGHPDFADYPIDLSASSAVIVGNGNVALDIARLLLRDPKSLEDTDIHPAALAALQKSCIRQVTLVGRRGASQASFSAAELEEVVSLPECDVEISWGGGAPDEGNAVCEILQRAAARDAQGHAKRIVFRFLESPVRVEGTDCVERLVLARNRFTGSGSAAALETTDETHTLACERLFESIGHHGVALPGVPFDSAAGVIPTDETGRVQENGAPVPGLYAAGWIARGAKGLIGHSKRHAKQVVDGVRADRESLRAEAGGDIDALLTERGLVPVRLHGVSPSI